MKESYGELYFKRRVEIMSGFMTGGIKDVWPVINAYTDALLDVWPQKRYNPMDAAFKVRTFISTHLPEVVYDHLYIDYEEPAQVARE